MSRFLMYPSVYDHHVGRIAGSMFAHGLDAAINSGDTSAFEIQLMDDYELNVRMRGMNKYSADMINRLNSRNLFKRAVYVGFDSLDKSIIKYTKIHRDIEREIARMADIDSGYVLVDIPRIPEFREGNAMVLMENGQLKYIDDVSEPIRLMEESYASDWRMGVYTLPEYREKVGKVARDYFNVEKIAKQSKLETV
jgi:HD superfamily phosphohydrolase